MSDLHFEWDRAKAASNARKHGVEDPDHSAEEDRFILLGLSGAARHLVVVHAFRESEAVIRIISARKATRAERRQYDERRG